MTLAYGKALQDETIKSIAARHNATPAQVVLAWALKLGYAVLPSSTKRENLASNLLAQQLMLTDEDMAQIATLECNGRLVTGRPGAKLGLIFLAVVSIRRPSGRLFYSFRYSFTKSIKLRRRLLTALSL